MQEKKLKPSTYLLIAVIYFINPFDFPTLIDDAIVGVLMVGLSIYTSMATRKVVDKAVEAGVMTEEVATGIVSEAVSKVPEQVMNVAKQKKSDILKNSQKFGGSDV